LTGAVQGTATRWREDVETSASVQVHARFEDGRPALMSAGSRAYLAGWLEKQELQNLMEWCLDQARLQGLQLPADIRLRRRGGFIFAFNYSNEAWDVPSFLGSVVIGSQRLEPGGVTILATSKHQEKNA
jgi:beta-galactosidase